MGTMERIRKTSPYALALFAVVFIGFMVISDADIGSIMDNRTSYQTSPIAVINGEEVLYRDFNALVEERIEQMRVNSKDPDYQVDDKQIRADIWNELLEQTLLKQEAEKAGLFVSDADIQDVMIEEPPSVLRQMFTDSVGNFNKAAYLDIITNPDNLTNYLGNAYEPEKVREIISNLRMDLINIENYLREQKLMEYITLMVNASESIVSPEYVKERYIADNSTVSVDYIFLDVNSVADDQISVTENELRQYYDKKKKYYEQKPVRKVKYINFPLIPSSEDTLRAVKKVSRIEEELNKATTLETRDSIFDVRMSEYGGNTNDYTMTSDIDKRKTSFLDSLEKLQVIGPIHMGPEGISFFRLDDRRLGENEMVKASHILVNLNDNKDSARAEALRILKMAKGNDEFSDLARQYSQDRGSAAQGGDLGFFGKGAMVKEFEEAAFAAKVGEITGPVESQFGYHIIKVIDKKSEEIKYSEIIIKPTITMTTKNKLFRDAFSIQRQAEEGTPFDTMIFRLKLIPGESGYVTKDQAILGSKYLTHLAFANPVGAVIQPVELDDYGIVVMQVNDAKQGGFKDFDMLKDQLKTELILQKKLDNLEQKANDIYNKIIGLKNLSEISDPDPFMTVRQETSLKQNANIPGIGIDVVFSTEAFRLPEGKISKPIRGQRGYYILTPYDRKVMELTESNQEVINYQNQIKQRFAQRAYFDWFAKVKENAIIDDRRHEFYNSY